MLISIRSAALQSALLLSMCCFVQAQQSLPTSGSFIATLGNDTVIVETYTMMNNHLYGKAFKRVPEDYIELFNVHFYPDGSIRELDVVAMDAQNSSLPFKAESGAFSYRMTMSCMNDTCTFYMSNKGSDKEYVSKHHAKHMDFLGGWTPIVSLMEWNCKRLLKSSASALSINMINDYIGVFNLKVWRTTQDSVIFGGPFLEYTRIGIDNAGNITGTNGIGTPWNYIVKRLPPVDVEQYSKRISLTPKIGNPSPRETVKFNINSSNIDIEYGRPYKRGRVIFGGIVPYDSAWRTGAGDPTRITFDKDVRINNKVVPKGQYSLYTIPGKQIWQLILNKDLHTWPTDRNTQQDFLITPMKIKKNTKTLEQLTITVEENKNGGILQIAWDDLVASVELQL